MKKPTVEELQKQLATLQKQSKFLQEEVNLKDKTIQLLIVAGYLDKEKLEQATELAGGV